MLLPSEWALLGFLALSCVSVPGVLSGEDGLTTPDPIDPIDWSDYECGRTECQNGGTCTSYYGFNVCECTAGNFGPFCEYQAGCSCLNGGFCNVNFFTDVQQCNCLGGWTGDFCGIETRDNDPCATHHCEHGGTCYHYGDYAFCLCTYDYQGPHCDDELSCEYESNRCENGGSCLLDSFCLCPYGWTGIRCTEKSYIPECFYTFCENGGVCDVDILTGAPECNCLGGWEGDYCEIETTGADPCERLDCSHGGTCYHNGDYPYCLCTDGYLGPYCDDELSCEYESNRCENGGSCLLDSFCLCPYGWTGIRCTEKIFVDDEFHCDDLTNPCENGGSCTFNLYCECAPGWTGSRCTRRESTPCDGLCLNGGSCRLNSYDRPKCTCAGTWYGDRCQKQPETYTSGSSIVPIVTPIGVVAFVMVITAVGLLILRSARRSPARSLGAPRPAHPVPSPAVIYQPGVDNLGFAAGPAPAANAVPAGKYPTGNGVASSDPRQQRYTNPVAGKPRYDYASQPGGRPGPAVTALPLLEGARPPMLGPRSELRAYDYAYAHATPPPQPQPQPQPPAYTPLDPGRFAPDPPTGSQGRWAAPSRAGSRLTEHTYQSISEYQAAPPPSVKSGGAASSVHSLKK